MHVELLPFVEEDASPKIASLPFLAVAAPAVAAPKAGPMIPRGFVVAALLAAMATMFLAFFWVVDQVGSPMP